MVDHVYKPVGEMEAEAKDFIARFKLLGSDIAKCNKPLKKHTDEQFWRRVVVRNIFVLLEACAYGMKRAALHRSRHFEIGFTTSELALLSEEKYYLDDGEPKTDANNYQRFIPNFKFAFKGFAKSFGFQFSLDTSKSPLKDFEQLRNRLTHPKKLSDLTITDPEAQMVQRLWKWFNDEFERLMNGVKAQPRLTVRKPDVKVAKRFSVSKPYVVFLPDGYLYQFDTRKEAEAHEKAHTVKGSLPPVVFNLADSSSEEP
jgi:hypothetical protein